MTERWSSSEKIVAVAVARRFGGKDHSWPSIGTIARDAGLCERTAGPCLRTLVNGDPTRKLLPMYTRERRGRGWLYRFIGNPEALVKGRKRHTDLLEALTAAVMGKRRSSGVAIELDPDTEEIADDLRRRKAELDTRRLQDRLTAAEYKRQLGALEREIETVARSLAPQYQQDLPRKHERDE